MPTARSLLRLALPALAGLLFAFSTASAEPPAADPAAALEGGTALPEGAWTVKFPWMGKQSILFVSDAEIERMVGVVKFDVEGHADLGAVTLDGKGGGSGSFKVPMSDLTTGNKGRDGHLAGDQWLDAAKHPEITYTITKLERVKPTVYRATGTWKMHGVEKPLVTLANVRFIKEMANVPAPSGIARLKTKFQVSLKEFGVANPYVGSSAVADAWDVEIVVLGILAK